MANLKLLRFLAKVFIWTGAVTCSVNLLLAIPSLGSFASFLLILSDTIQRLTGTVGIGALLLALAEIAEGTQRINNTSTKDDGKPS